MGSNIFKTVARLGGSPSDPGMPVIHEDILNGIILQTARIYSRAIGKSNLLAVCSRDSLQVLSACSINNQVEEHFRQPHKYENRKMKLWEEDGPTEIESLLGIIETIKSG